MAISSASSLGCPVVTGNVVVPASVRGQWTTLISNVEATAESATVLLRPLSATSSYIVPLRVGGSCTRFFARMKSTAGGAVATSPVIRFYGLYGSVYAGTGAFVDDDTTYSLRLDNADANAAGVTVTASIAAQLRDANYEYTDIVPDLDGWDLMGCDYLIALIETAASITGSGVLQVMALN